MSKSIKFRNDTYLDSSSVVHNKNKLSNILKDSGWQYPTLLNNWSNKNFSKCRYRKIGNIVYIEGVVGNNSNTSKSTIFILPKEYRPTYNYSSFPCRDGGGTSRIYVATDGTIVYEKATGDNTELSLYGISFFVD